MKNRLLFLLFFLLGMLFCGSLNAQTVRSTNITKISGKEYYMHHVKQGETLWGLSRLYNVSIEEIESLNPDVKNGLKTGHVLGIPVRPEREPNNPVVVEPKPKEQEVVVQPEPVPEPEPVVVEPEPEKPAVVVQPEPEPEPEPVVVDPEPEPEPVVVVPEPEPEPVVVVPEPEPEPIVEEPKPIVVEPEPAVVEPQTTEQPVVVRPDNRRFYVDKARIVQNEETLYDIAKEYGIDLADLRAANRGLTDEPAPGTRIIIPAIANENDYIVHHCERNERVTSLLKRWKVDESDFRRMNVSVGSHVFVNQVVLIPILPITDFYWMEDEPQEIVEPEEELAVEEEVVPVQEETTETLFEEEVMECGNCVASHENASHRYNVALMVPLYLNDVGNLEISKESAHKAQKSRALSFVQFYEGFMMAVDAMEDQRLKMNLTVIDVTDNVSTAERALSQIQGEDFDLIVGPFFGKSFAVIEEYAKAHNIVVVNPLSTRESVIVDNPNVVKVKPGEVGQILTISNLVKNLYNDANVFIVSKERAGDTLFLNQLEHHLNLAVNDEVRVSGNEFLHFARNESERLEMGSRMVSTVDVEGQVYSTEDFRNGTTNEVVLSNAVKRYAYKDISKVISQLSGVRENVIVAYGDDNVFATQMLNSLAKETDRYPITLVCAPDWAKFEKLLVENLLQMKAIYLDDGFVDYSSDAARRFVVRFRQKYAVEPQSYAFEGYDMAMFFLSALMRYGDDMLDCLNCCDVPLLNSQYRFFNPSYLKDGKRNGRENQYWSVYQYDNEDIKLKPIDPFKRKTE
ncbi:MAG: LysM peptidoglycan-binding domain-containing protein [Bacteroidales bacterium]|nr:LysM peptidoglycan-binding domain-containing protein [Bacteroidales bacterium]